MGLAALGPLVVEHVLVPALARGDYMDKLEAAAGLTRRVSAAAAAAASALDEDAPLSDAEVVRRDEAARVLHALRVAVRPLAQTSAAKLAERLGAFEAAAARGVDGLLL